ncbi:hypothetical protein [Micromonospora chersina]|uniref:hypothetical protein n=1 Tax=Micromonospora chersina TaxID=47854 RepID=UPI0033C06C42
MTQPAALQIAVYHPAFRGAFTDPTGLLTRTKDPLLTATDTTFTFGRVGFGSFDNIGRTRLFTVTGMPAA